MINKTHTIVINHEGRLYKLLKLVYGGDGSIFITSPYHPCKEGMIMLATVNYAIQDMKVYFSEAIEIASVDDEENGFKLSHHVSGLIQVSGPGILSGLDVDGKPKGIGIQSWPLEQPVAGPAFGAIIYGFEHFKQVPNVQSDFHVFNFEQFQKDATFKALAIEGHCFPSSFRRYVRQENSGAQMINLVHPSGLVIPLKVAFPPLSCKCQSFFGLELYFDQGEADQPAPSILLSSSSGNIRRNEKNESLGDMICCVFPRAWKTGGRTLKFPGVSTQENRAV